MHGSVKFQMNTAKSVAVVCVLNDYVNLIIIILTNKWINTLREKLIFSPIL